MVQSERAVLRFRLSRLIELDVAIDSATLRVETTEPGSYAYKKAVKIRSRLLNVERIALELLNGGLI